MEVIGYNGVVFNVELGLEYMLLTIDQHGRTDGLFGKITEVGENLVTIEGDEYTFFVHQRVIVAIEQKNEENSHLFPYTSLASKFDKLMQIGYVRVATEQMANQLISEANNVGKNAFVDFHPSCSGTSLTFLVCLGERGVPELY